MQKKHIIILYLILFSHISYAENKSIEPDALLTLIETQQAPLILDVRSAQEFAQGHIKGSINIDYRSLQHDKNINNYKDKRVIIYCRSGNRAKVAANILHKKGFNQLIDLRGHMLAWQALHYPINN